MNRWDQHTATPLPYRAMVCCAILCLFLGAAVAAAGETHAVVIAHNEGLESDRDLRYAQSDALHVGETLVEVGAVTRARLTTSIGTGLTTARRAITALADRINGEDRLLVFLSAHGDHRGLHFAGQIWPWRDIRNRIVATGARVAVVFVDACQSGAFLTTKGFVKVPRLDISVTPLGPQGQILITSSGFNELSYESAMLKASPFAQFLVSGLRGAADQDRDGRVSVGELYSHLYSRVLATTLRGPAGPQHAAFEINLHGAGDVILANLERGRYRVHWGDLRAAICYILDGAGRRVLAELGPDHPGGFPLLPGSYLIKCLGDDGLQVAELDVTGTDLHLDRLTFESQPRTLALAKGPRRVWRRQLQLSGGISNLAGRSVWPAVDLDLRLALRNGGVDLRVIGSMGTMPGDTGYRGWLAGLLGLDVRVSWWRVLSSTLFVGIEAGVGGNLGGDDPRGTAALVGPYVKLAWPLVSSLSLVIRGDFLSDVPLKGEAPVSFNVFGVAGLALEFPKSGTRGSNRVN